MKRLLPFLPFLLVLPMAASAQEAFPPDSSATQPGDITVGGQILKDDGTPAAPASSYVSEPDTGEYLEASGTLGFSVDAQPAQTIEQDETKIQSQGCYAWSNSTSDASTTTELALCKLAASTATLSGSFRPSAGNVYHLGSSGNYAWQSLWLSSYIAGAQEKDLAEGFATVLGWSTAFSLDGFSAYVSWTAFAADASNSQSVTGTTIWTCVTNSGTTPTCGVTNLHTNVSRVTSGTFTCTPGTSYKDLYTAQFTLNCTSSLTQTTMKAYYRANFTLGYGWITSE